MLAVGVVESLGAAEVAGAPEASGSPVTFYYVIEMLGSTAFDALSTDICGLPRHTS